MKRPLWTLVGFAMFATGILSVILWLVGLKLTFLNVIYNLGAATIIIQLILLFGGVIIMYVARTDQEE